MTDLTLALDSMGGDHGPQVIVPAVVQALALYPQLNILLVGDESLLGDLLRRHQAQQHPRLQIVHAAQVVGMDERPLSALRNKKQSSMRIALELVADGTADACVSSGNTGALMSMAKVLIKTLPGVDRPALITGLPTHSGGTTYLLDLGANISCDSETLFQFAVMGSAIAESVNGIQNPKIALLNVGTEEIKGNDQVQQAAQLIKETPQLNYAGFIEGDRLYRGDVDVIVCDGFVGNIALKSSEGVARLLSHHIRASIQGSPWRRLLAKVFAKKLDASLNRLNPDQYNGASLIGLRSIVVKSHGNADQAAFLRAIQLAKAEVEVALQQQVTDRLEQVLLDKTNL
ncbi:phosphate acyltransferase PlsX [Paraferrimonas sedimenticola]|uniref:Phosphate acyltransferase n=1 Tax=Paraferrimonas sedimenticola TaxID=375674 RepID=A0AA37RXK5_9GAMM|nr:phosphate acyltransferase PlsX [Paraferrimonas sedimenticola]GLP96497.1 phosphate acyltransferase [Paraferrimonas sedimenticola]